MSTLISLLLVLSIQSEASCLAQALHHEARGEAYRGHVAVASVIRKRVKDPRWPDTYCEVINTKNTRGRYTQFTYKDHKTKFRPSFFANRVILGLVNDNTGGATHYHNNTVNPRWGLKHTKTIGKHRFYK